MGNENTNNQTITFDNINNYIGIKNPNLFKSYLHEIFLDLTNRSQNKLEKCINKVDFYNYMKFPFFISEKLFQSFDCNDDDKLNENEFIIGLSKLYLGTFEETAQAIFNFLDYDKDKKINKEDVKLMLSYLPLKKSILSKNEIQEKSLLEINDIINKTFKKFNNELNFKQFLDVILNKTSDVYLQIISYFYLKKPFTNENINIIKNKIPNNNFINNEGILKSKTYKNKSISINMKKIASSNLSSLNIFLKNGKIPLSPKSNKDLIHKNPINYFPKFNRRKSSTNLYNDINILKSSLKNPIKYLNRENKINNVNISSDLNTSRSSNEESKNNIYENYTFQLTNNGKMNKIYLELINSDLYIYSNETKYNLIEMHNLKGCIIRDYIL